LIAVLIMQTFVLAARGACIVLKRVGNVMSALPFPWESR